jgi:hypothetical protein
MNKDWKSLKDGFMDEMERRMLLNPSEFCSYGIQPLDDALYCIDRPSFVILDKRRRGFLDGEDYFNATSGLGVRGLEIASADRDARAILLDEGVAGNFDYKLICNLEYSYVFGVRP